MTRPRFGPMTGGLEMDIETGDPVAPQTLDKLARDEQRRQRVMTRHFDLVSDLAGGGGPVVRLIAAKLAARIDHLISQDEQAAAYLALLKDLQAELRVGERVIADEVQDLFARD